MEEKSPFPFNMIEGMMPMYPMILLMGLMIVIVALLIGLFVLGPAQADLFSVDKAAREAAGTGSALALANTRAHAIEAWVPPFKFFGLGLMLMAITMALGTIAQKLRAMGMTITSHMPDDLRPPKPPIPGRVRVFQLSAVMGIMILMAALVIGIVLAATTVPAYWNNSIADTLNPAGPGSAELAMLATLTSIKAWLVPFKFVGMAFLFFGITLALTVIIGTLRLQAGMLVNFYNAASQR
jgi:hypothetical protein